MYYNEPYKFYTREGIVHVSFMVGEKIYSFELNEYSMDYVSLAIWDSEEEYLESFEELKE